MLHRVMEKLSIFFHKNIQKNPSYISTRDRVLGSFMFVTDALPNIFYISCKRDYKVLDIFHHTCIEFIMSLDTLQYRKVELKI